MSSNTFLNVDLSARSIYVRLLFKCPSRHSMSLTLPNPAPCGAWLENMHVFVIEALASGGLKGSCFYYVESEFVVVSPFPCAALAGAQMHRLACGFECVAGARLSHGTADLSDECGR